MVDDLTFLLKRLVEENVPGCRAAVLLSADGLPKAWHGVTKDDADYVAAMASSFCSLAKQVGNRFVGAANDGVRQVMAEVGGIFLYVTAPSVGTVLAVLANPEVDAKVLSYEMARMGAQLPQHLATPARHDIAGQLGNW